MWAANWGVPKIKSNYKHQQVVFKNVFIRGRRELLEFLISFWACPSLQPTFLVLLMQNASVESPQSYSRTWATQNNATAPLIWGGKKGFRVPL